MRFPPSSRRDKKPKSTEYSFGFKKDNNLLEKLYWLNLEAGPLIDREKTSLHTFLSVLTSSDFKNLDGHIYIGCQSRQAAYIFSLLKKLNPRFTQKRIGESRRFFSKDGTLFTANHLSKALHGPTEVADKAEIDNFFDSSQQ